MSDLSPYDALPPERRADLDDVRKLELTYRNAERDRVNLFVEYVGGRIEILRWTAT
jgi:hypothetical protein